MITFIIISTICAALAISLITLWRSSTNNARTGALVALELILSGMAIALAAIQNDALIIDVAIAWILQAAAVLAVITTTGAIA